MSFNQLKILCCIESGALEFQGKLLVRSINRWLEPGTFQVFAYSPRKKSLPSQQTQDELNALGVNLVMEPINQDFLFYPIANKLLACQHFEKHLAEDGANILFTDTDTIFMNRFDHRSKGLFLRPVDNKGPGSEGKNDANDEFWQSVFDLCGVTIPPANVETTVRPSLIRNYFNAGLVWSNGVAGFFQQWHDDFITIINSNLRPFGWQSRDGDDFRCLDQVALAVTATRFNQELKVLPNTFNYPIPFKPLMKGRENHPNFDELIHVHYHKWFNHPGFLNHVTTDQERATAQFEWLQKELPLRPTIADAFKC